MEDGIPTRPAGFCNVNQIFEAPTELAGSIEVIRGPANALYGSNGLHGTVNTFLPAAGQDRYIGVRGDAGSNEYKRGRINFDTGEGDNAYAGGLMYDYDGGYRDDSGYNESKAYGKSLHQMDTGDLQLSVSGSWLDQETAGFITGEDAYKEDDRFRNENPEAYRNAYSLRTSATWTPDAGPVWAPEYRVYARNSKMRFLQHFLPTQPTEKNGQTSGGFMFITHRDLGEQSLLTLGVDTEYAHGYLKEANDEFPEGTSNFLQETRPLGQHYDFDVDSYMAAGYASITIPFAERWELQTGLRAEFMRYDYDNNMLAGNTRDDGTECGFGGCLYNRPADRDDDFFNVSPNIGLLYHFSDETVAFTNFVSGFRAPQANELYRLQADQDVSDIDSEELNSIETGARHISERVTLETVVYYMRKKNFIFRDSEGLNVSDGRTKHYGIEGNLSWRIIEPVYLALTGSWAKHKYDFDRSAGLGEEISKGNEVDTAPQVLGSARLGYEYTLGLVEAEWIYQDAYFMDAANTARYDGHHLLNLRATFNPTDQLDFGIRLNNVTDEKYADRGDLLSVTDPNIYRYFPGRDREIFFEIGWRTD
jgi:outer membrane receptor protein involved in Fe transport